LKRLARTGGKKKERIVVGSWMASGAIKDCDPRLLAQSNTQVESREFAPSEYMPAGF
jgi:hypothetical protein